METKGLNPCTFTFSAIARWPNSGSIQLRWPDLSILLLTNSAKLLRSWPKTEIDLWRLGMSSSTVETIPLASSVKIDDAELTVLLVDGRRVSVPLVWFPRLVRATQEQRDRWELLGDGEGIHWPEIDEDLSIEGLLVGRRSRSS
jgi:hypothetical protein